ncbi:hypothetical protein AH97_25050 [Salmonella enterica subsp. enterica]|nr:hypothetical protein [Salmonella enterica subsp. enterica serovar Hartford]
MMCSAAWGAAIPQASRYDSRVQQVIYNPQNVTVVNTTIASIPYVSGNTFSYGLAVGNYRNGNALAGGVQYKTSPNTNVRLNVSWDSSGNAALGAGLAGGW